LGRRRRLPSQLHRTYITGSVSYCKVLGQHSA
jgi:hypothetical protein